MNSSRIAKGEVLLKVAAHTFGPLLNATKVRCGGALTNCNFARWSELGDGLLEVRIGHSVGVEFEAVAGQLQVQPDRCT